MDPLQHSLFNNNYVYYGGIITLSIIIIFILYKVVIYFKPKPIDGKFTEWSDWSKCSLICGGGKTIRTRKCIPPKNGGAPCKGELEESNTCNTLSCEKKPQPSYNVLITARGLTGTELLIFLDKDFNQIHQQRLTTDFKNFSVNYFKPIYIIFENPTIRNQIEFKQFIIEGEEEGLSLKKLQFIMFKDIEKISKPDDPTLKEDILEFYENSVWLSSLANKGFFIVSAK